MSSSPWGTIQETKKFATGLSFITTAGHGGFRVSKGFAEKHLTKEAINLALVNGNYLYYEEDCLAFVVLFELFDAIDFGASIKIEDITLNLSSYYPDYLIAMNVEPDKDRYERYKLCKLTRQLEANNDSDIIVSACGDWHAKCLPGEVMVVTADSKHHFVLAGSYDLQKRYDNKELNLLSYCTLTREN